MFALIIFDHLSPFFLISAAFCHMCQLSAFLLSAAFCHMSAVFFSFYQLPFSTYQLSAFLLTAAICHISVFFPFISCLLPHISCLLYFYHQLLKNIYSSVFFYLPKSMLIFRLSAVTIFLVSAAFSHFSAPFFPSISCFY